MIETKTAPQITKVVPKIQKERKPRKQQVYISNVQRLEILILITEFHLSCYQAARVLDIPYTNAKVIYRVYRVEKRVTSNAGFRRKEDFTVNGEYLLKNSILMRKNAFVKLQDALRRGVMSGSQATKVYDQNFTVFITNPVMSQFRVEGRQFLGDTYMS